MRNFALVLLFVTLALPALAADGVLEINQTCAVNTGCFAGDAAGFPVTIGTAGSYILTTDLESPTGAIEVQANGTTINLNGFAVRAAGLPALAGLSTSGVTVARR